MLKNVELLEYIRGGEEQLFDKKIMKAKGILYRLSKTVRDETVEIDAVVVKNAEYIKHPSFENKHVLVYNEHIVVVEKPPKISDQNKTLELLGKNYKLSTDKQEITQRNIEINIGEYDDTN